MVLPGMILFPGMLVPLYIYEPRYRKMLADCLKDERYFCLVMQDPDIKKEMPSKIGCLGLVRAAVRHSNGTAHLFLQGLDRVKLLEPTKVRPYRRYTIQTMANRNRNHAQVKVQMEKLKTLLRLRGKFGYPDEIASKLDALLKSLPPKLLKKNPLSFDAFMRQLQEISNPSVAADMVASVFLLDPRARQKILATNDLVARLKYLNAFLTDEISRSQESTEPETDSF